MFAMVGSHATGSDSAEGKFLHTEVHDGVVDTDAPAGGPPGEQLLHLLAGGEEVEGQGLVPTVDDVDGLLSRVDGDDGQDGTEYLVLHQGIVQLDLSDDSGSHELLLGRALPADDDLPLGGVQEGLEPRLVAVRHDPAVVRGGDRVRVELLDDLLQQGQDLVLDRLGAEDVVRGHTDLAAVVELAPAESLDGVLQVTRPVNVGRGLPAQLQRAGGQVLVSCSPGMLQSTDRIGGAAL